MPAFYFYPELRFNCRSCDIGCCARMAIPISEAERKSLRRLNIPELPPEDECFPSSPDGNRSLGKRPDGSCVYADGVRCRIHAVYGYAAKPLACRIFPLHLQLWKDGGISAEYRFFCSGVAAGEGKKLGELTSQVRVFASELASRRPPDDAVYSARNPLPLEKVRKIFAGYRQILHDENLAWPVRLYGMSRVLAFHARPEMERGLAAADDAFADEAKSFLLKSRTLLEAELDKRAGDRPDVAVRTAFHQLVCAYLREDDPAARQGFGRRLARSFHQLRIVLGGGSLADLNSAAPAAPGGRLTGGGVPPEMRPAAAELFRHFFYGKLDSMHFCGRQVHNYTFEEGMRHLLLLAPVTMALAAGYAAAAGRGEIDGWDMRRAACRADATFARSPVFRVGQVKGWMERLAKPEHYAALLAATFPKK